jgi:hypothetical protein
MEMVRARVTFPYKVGHFFISAGPLRADLVKFRGGSRDFPCGGAAARPPAAPPLRCGRVPGAGRSGAPGCPWRARRRVHAWGGGGTGGFVGGRCIDGPRWAGDIYVERGWTVVRQGGWIYIRPPRMIYFGMHGLAVHPDWPAQASRPPPPHRLRPGPSRAGADRPGDLPTGENKITCRVLAPGQVPMANWRAWVTCLGPRANWRVSRHVLRAAAV